MANEHAFRIPSLGLALLEMSVFGEDYASRMVENARALGQALHDRGFKVLCEPKGFTRTHQVVMDISSFGDSEKVTSLLEEAGILCKQVMIPKDDCSKNEVATYPPERVSGLRLGVAEVTRLGMNESDMVEIATLIERVLFKKDDSKRIRKTVEEFREKFDKICFSSDTDADAYEYYIKSSTRPK